MVQHHCSSVYVGVACYVELCVTAREFTFKLLFQFRGHG